MYMVLTWMFSVNNSFLNIMFYNNNTKRNNYIELNTSEATLDTRLGHYFHDVRKGG